jgi:drug/metabolite transporter (DMT)-like permease
VILLGESISLRLLLGSVAVLAGIALTLPWRLRRAPA